MWFHWVKAGALWISFILASYFVPRLRPLPPDLVFYLDCSLLVLWPHCCLLEKTPCVTTIVLRAVTRGTGRGRLSLPTWCVVQVLHHSSIQKVPVREGRVGQITLSSRLWTLVKSKHGGEFFKIPTPHFSPGD